MIQKPKFIDPIQKVKAGAVRLASVSLEGPAADGTYPVDSFLPGMAEMAEDDWRQFELTPENARAMVEQANADIASGKPSKRIRMNYAHDRNGPKAGDVARVELTAVGGVRSWVKWTQRAQAAIRDGEWEGTSPEFYARVVLDDKGNPVETNGRVLMQPFALVGGALDNDPAMPDLAIAASTETDTPENGQEENMELKSIATKLGLPEQASHQDVDKKLDELVTAAKAKPSPAAAAGEPPVTVAAVAAAVLAQIDPKKLAGEITEAAKTQALETIRAEEREKASVAAVDGAILAGRVKKSEREAALKLAKVDLDAFKTMTAAMKVVAPVAPTFVAGGDPTARSFDEEDPTNDEAFVEQAGKRAAEKKISILAAARELRAEAQAKS